MQRTLTQILVDEELINRLIAQLEANTVALEAATTQFGNTRFYEAEAAKYLGVQKCTMYDYRERGLPFEKVGRIVSYLRKDLDAWRSAGRTKTLNSR